MSTRNRNLLIILTVFLSVVLSGCHNDSNKEKIAKMLQLMQSGAENKNAGSVLAHVSRNYRDPHGNDYQWVKELLLFYFFRHQRVSIIMTGLEIEVHDAAAEARFQAILSGRSGSSATILPEALGAYWSTVSLTNEAGEWKVTSAQWERFGDGPPATAQ